jgi:hypothetical protein
VVLDARFAIGLVKRHPWYILGWIVLCCLLEAFFSIYPPRGFVGTNVILLGSIRGEPLVHFPLLWEKLVNDDQFMLKLLKEQEKAVPAVVDALNVINRKIRPGLRFSAETNTLVKITFRQSQPQDTSTFIRLFSAHLIEELHKLEEEILRIRVSQAKANLALLRRRAVLLEKGFGFSYKEVAGNLIQSFIGLESDAAPASPPTDLDGKEEFSLEKESASGFLTTAGYLAMNELDAGILRAQIEWEKLTSEGAAGVAQFPRKAVNLTDAAARPVNGQPNIVLFYLFLPIGCLGLALAGLLFIELPLIEERESPASGV